MSKKNKALFTIILSILMLIAVTLTCYGNSAEPPSILIIVPNAPDDLEISIGSNNSYEKADKIDKTIEMYYAFYSRSLRKVENYNLKISMEGSTFEIPLDKPLKSYNNIYTLDLKNRTLTPGKSLSRSITLVSLRITLTLVIEALVFLLLGYRQKKSWITFLIINLLTQGGLNIWLNGSTPMASYIILTLIFGEIIVFIVEIITFLIFLKEHSRLRAVLYVLIANVLSLIAGGYIIAALPI